MKQVPMSHPRNNILIIFQVTITFYYLTRVCRGNVGESRSHVHAWLKKASRPTRCCIQRRSVIKASDKIFGSSIDILVSGDAP
jgi:hypothetical protein